MKHSFYCGTSNIMLPVKNKTFFPDEYKDKSRLSYYASLLNSLEVNSTFYKLPLPRTVARWVGEVPDDFRFTFKLWREVTHAKGFVYHNDHIDSFLQAVYPAIEKAGCLLIQFPQSIKFSQFRKVKALLEYMTRHKLYNGWKLAIEFRDTSWYNDTIWEMLDKYEAAIVQHDMPKSATPDVVLVANIIYLRFHGLAGDYRGSYPEDVLSDYASYIKQLLKQKKDVYAYFNNTIGDAIHNVLELQKFVVASAPK